MAQLLAIVKFGHTQNLFLQITSLLKLIVTNLSQLLSKSFITQRMSRYYCDNGSFMPLHFKKFSPEKKVKDVKSFLKLGHLCDMLVKYIEWHIGNDAMTAFAVNGSADCREVRTTEFIVKVTSIAAKAVKKAKDSVEACPELPRRIRDNMSVLDDPFVASYNRQIITDIAYFEEDSQYDYEYDYEDDWEYDDHDMEKLETTTKVVTKIAEFENHNDDDLKMLRSTYEALANWYSSVKELSHFTFCYSHYMSHCYTEEMEFDTVRDLEEEMGEFELDEYWQ